MGGCGELADEDHVKARGEGGRLSLRAGWHSTLIPFTDWIGARQADGTLAQRKDTVWCECEVDGYQVKTEARNGFAKVPTDCWYYFKTNSKQKDPWIISDLIKVNRILSNEEVAKICRANGTEPQPIEASA